MKKLILFQRPKYRNNNVIIEDNKIQVFHNGKIKISKIDLKEVFEDTNRKNDILSSILNIYDGYCPEILKNKLKALRAKPNDELAYCSFDEELSKNFELYTSIYNEKELAKIILNFGKDIFNLTKIDLNSCYNETDNIETFYKKTYNLTIELIKKSNIARLNRNINKLIFKIGVPTAILKKEKELYSIWNTFIYISLLCYLYKEVMDKKIKTKVNFLELLKYILYTKFNKTIFECEYMIINLQKDTKEVMKIKSLIPFVIFYLDNHYNNSQYYEFWLSDHLIDELDDFRKYLLIKFKKETKKNEIEAYSYEELEKKYRRKKLNY